MTLADTLKASAATVASMPKEHRAFKQATKKGNVLAFPTKSAGDPLDDVVMCQLTIDGKGEINLIVNAECVETVEQHNWLIAKIVDAASRLIGRKNDIIEGDGG